MSQTVILRDLLAKFIEKMTLEYELSSLQLSEKWSKLSDSSTENTKTPTESSSNHESSIFSRPANKPEPYLRKHPSISEALHHEIPTPERTSSGPFSSDDVNEPDTRSKYYLLSKTSAWLQKAMHNENLDFLGLNSYFLSTYLLEISSSSELLIKCVTLSHFISLIMESFSSENQNSLNDIFSLVVNRHIPLNPSVSGIFSEDQLRNAFVNSFRKLLSLRAKPHVSFTKLAKSFAYLIWQKPVFLESLVVLLKEMMVVTLNKSVNFVEKELTQRAVMNVWNEPRRDLIRLMAESLNRSIEIFELKENRLEQSVFRPITDEKKGFINNKITLLVASKNEGVWVSLILNISEKECFERLENLSKEEIAFLEEETNMTASTSKSMNLIPAREKEKNVSNFSQDWRKTNTVFLKCKEVMETLNLNSEKMAGAYQQIIEKPVFHPATTTTFNANAMNTNEFKENIVPRENNDRFFNSGNKVERVDLVDRGRDKSRSRSPMIYYNQQNPCGFDNRLKTITTIPNVSYATPNPVIIDNRVRRHYTTNHLPTIGNNLFGYN